MIGSKELTAGVLAKGITEVTTDQSIINAAGEISSKVQREDGVMNAIKFIDKMAISYRYPWNIKV